MSDFEKIVQIVTAIVAFLTFIWGVVSAIITHKQSKKIAILQSQLEKGTYVSNAVFDKLFLEFQKLSECLFDNCNNVSVKLFPTLEQVLCRLPHDEKVEKMREYYNESIADFNDLVRLIHINKLLLPKTIFDDLIFFERTTRELVFGYKDKLRDAMLGRTFDNGAFTRENERESSKKADELSKTFDKIEEKMLVYLNSLQVIEK